MAKKVFLLMGIFLLAIPVIALGSYPLFYYPNVPVFDNKSVNGVFHVYVETEGKWESAGVLSFDRYFRQKTVDITKYVGGNKAVKIRLEKEGGGSAQIDSVLLNGAPPFRASGIDTDLKKLAKDDFDVVDAAGKGIGVEFGGTEGKAILSLSARIEEVTISKTPFQYPVANLYKNIGVDSKFYNYRMGKNTRGPKKLLFREYSVTGSGHPSGYTYCWVGNDKKNLYVRLDFTPDDTMDGDLDYAKVYVKTEGGIKEFKISVPETRWGSASFIYTDKVTYQHKVYDFAIPLREIGINGTGKASEIKLAFAAYGTAAPSIGGSFNPSSNKYLVTYQRDTGSATGTDIFGQLVDSDGNPVGSEITISSALYSQDTPSVAYNSNTDQYLVVWQDNRSSNYDIYGQLVDSDGNLVGSEIAICTDSHVQYSPSVAYNSDTDQYLVVWQDNRIGNYDIYGQLVDASGSLDIGGNFPIATGTNSQTSAKVAYNSSTHKYLVVWQQSSDIYGRVVNANGTFPGSNFPISTASSSQNVPKVAYNSNTDQYLVVWDDSRNGGSIYGRYLTGAGSVTGGEFLIHSGASSSCVVANSVIGNYLVAFFSSGVYAWSIVGDTTPPDVSVTNPTAGSVVQDIITLAATASDSSGIKSVSFFVREPGGIDGKGIPIGMENLAGTYNSVTGHWEYSFDTKQLQDGNYVVLSKGVDNNNNEGWSSVVPFSIRNWAITKLLPSTANSKAGRTLPIKFTLRVASSVDPKTPFVYNEDLEIRIYKSTDPGTILQTSHFGTSSTDYRIDNIAKLYITNFKTLSTPATYVVEIWRPSNNFIVDSFTFKTVK